jgi:predicted amino acid-binding ACT domain protein
MSVKSQSQTSPLSPAAAGGRPGADLPWPFPAPVPLLVTAPLFVCEAKPAGRGRLAVTVSGRDRTGLLRALCQVASRHDQAVTIEAGFGRAIEDYCAIFLLLSHPLDPRRLAGLAERFRELMAEPVAGWQIPVASAARLRVRAPDCAGVLRGVCSVLDDEAGRANIRRFEFEAFARFPAGAEPLVEAAEPVCELHFDLELSAAALSRVEEMRVRIEQLGPGYDVELFPS